MNFVVRCVNFFPNGQVLLMHKINCFSFIRIYLFLVRFIITKEKDNKKGIKLTIPQRKEKAKIQLPKSNDLFLSLFVMIFFYLLFEKVKLW